MGLSSTTVFCFLQLFFICVTADGYSIGYILNNTVEEESNITSTKNEQPIIITSQSSIPVEDLSTSIPIKVFKALLMDNNATTNNSSTTEEESAEAENFLNEIISDEEFTQSILSTMANISSVNETKESTKFDILSTLPTPKTLLTNNLPIINTTTIPLIESTASLPKSLSNENSSTSPPVQNEMTNSTSSMDLMNLTTTLSIETTTDLNNSFIEPTVSTEENTNATTILFSQTSEEEYFENDTITTTEFLVDNTSIITSTMDTINSFVDTKNDSYLIVSSTEMAPQFSLNNQSFSTPSNASISSPTFNDSTTALNVTSSPFKKSLSITDCLTDVILIILVVLFVLFLIILLVLCCRKPAAPVIIVEEEKTIIIKESRYTSNPSDIEMGEENRPNNFMAMRSTFVTTSGSEDYDPTGLTNISEESETSDSVGKKKEEKSKKEVDEENDDDNNEVEQQIKSKDGVEVPETLQEQPSPSLYSFTKPANVAKANKPSSIYD
uniref:Candidate secreted effector n=1 Tax=Meloidogyne incognita TaxID=6306 RepID=A0A914MUC1_MELIC